MRPMSSKLRAITVGFGALVVLSGVAITLAARSASGEHRMGLGYGEWAPSLSVLSQARVLPTVQTPAPSLVTVVRHSATVTGGNPSTALASLRLLRSNLGAGHAGLY